MSRYHGQRRVCSLSSITKLPKTPRCFLLLASGCGWSEETNVSSSPRRPSSDVAQSATLFFSFESAPLSRFDIASQPPPSSFSSLPRCCAVASA